MVYLVLLLLLVLLSYDVSARAPSYQHCENTDSMVHIFYYGPEGLLQLKRFYDIY